MGDPKKHRKKFNKPTHPWQKQRLDDEAKLKKEYGLRNKKEVWKAVSKMKHYADLAKLHIGEQGAESQEEGRKLVARLYQAGVLPENANLNDILTIKPNDILERRLQTVLVKKKLARSLRQARQFITHGHIVSGSKKGSVPSYLVRRDEEDMISFADNSPMRDEAHPERVQDDATPQESPDKQASDEDGSAGEETDSDKQSQEE